MRVEQVGCLGWISHAVMCSGAGLFARTWIKNALNSKIVGPEQSHCLQGCLLLSVTVNDTFWGRKTILVQKYIAVVLFRRFTAVKCLVTGYWG